MSQKISNLLSKIFYTLEIIPTLGHQEAETLYKIYKSIVDEAALVNASDAKHKDLFEILGKELYYYCNDNGFLDTLSNAHGITIQNRAEVIGKLKSLEFAIRNSTN